MNWRFGRDNSNRKMDQAAAGRTKTRCVASIVSEFVGHCRQCNTNTRTLRVGYPYQLGFRARCPWRLGLLFLHRQIALQHFILSIRLRMCLSPLALHVL
jgi:hypothetical protein